MKADAAKKKRVNWTSLREEQEHIMGGCSASQCAKLGRTYFVKEENLAKNDLKGSQTFSGRSFRLIVQKPSLIAPPPILLSRLDLAGIDLVKIMSQVSFSTSTTIGKFKSQLLGQFINKYIVI